MKVLQVHKYFYPHAGSETALFQTRGLLRDRGHEVIDFAMQSPKNIDSRWSPHFSAYREYNDPQRPTGSRVVDAALSVYSPEAGRAIGGLLDEVRPDVAHLHLVYHQLTMSVVDVLHKRNIPMVMTLHDYIIGCPAHTLFRDGRICRDCVSGAPEQAVRHKCVKGSLGASVLGAAEARIARIRRSYEKIDVLIGPSRYAADVAVEAGASHDRVAVVPNFLAEHEFSSPRSAPPSSPVFFFAGRLEAIKGVREMLDVFSRRNDLGVLRIAGAGGELEAEVISAAKRWPHVQYLGRIDREQVAEELRSSTAALLVPVWAENNPMSILEARAAGVPVITTTVGGLPEMVTDGVDGITIPPGDSLALEKALERLAADPRLSEQLGRAGFDRVLRDNTPDAHYGQLMSGYERAQRVRTSRR